MKAPGRGPRRTRLRAVAAVAALGLVTSAGCGSVGTSDNGESRLRIATPQPIEGLNMHGIDAAGRVHITAAMHIFDTLVVKEGDEFVPSLATSWETPDDLTWVFHLREDATFHDGTPVTAEDVKVSLEQIFTLEGRFVQLWGAFESVEATDEHTVTIHTSEPMGTMLNNLTLLFIMPQRVADDTDLYNSDPMGSGPYQVEEFISSEVLRLSVNEDYWGEVPSVEELEFVWIPETSAVVTGLTTGEIDVTWELAPDQLSTVESEPDLQVEAVPSYIYYVNRMNFGVEPFDDINVRAAMWHAVDVQAIVDDLFPDTGAEVSVAPIPSPVFGWKPGVTPEYDPELARDLLAEAGYPDGFSTTIEFEREGGPQQREIVQALISYWSEIGVEVEMLEVERAVWLEHLLAKEYEMQQQTNPVLTGDADYTLGRLYRCDSNNFNYCNEELDEVLDAASTSLDQGERETLYGQAIDIILEDVVSIFTIDLPVNYVTRSNVSGLEPLPSGTPRFHDVVLN